MVMDGQKEWEKNNERFLATLNLEESDRVPIMDIVNNEKIRKIVETNNPLETNARAYRYLGIDITRDYWWLTDFMWFKNKFFEWMDILGIEKEGWTIKTKAGTTWIDKRPFKNLDELGNKLPPEPDESKIAEWFIPYHKKTIEGYKKHGIVFVGNFEGPLTEAYMFTGYDLFFQAMFMAKDIVNKLLDIFEKWILIRLKLWVEENMGDVVFLGEDIAFDKGLMFSPKWLNENWFPRIKRIRDFLFNKNIKMIFHSDGNLNPILDKLVFDLKIDALHPIDPTAGMKINEVKEKYGKYIALIGYIDCSHLLPFGTINEIIEKVKETLYIAAPSGGYILGSSSEIHDAIPIENAKVLYETGRKYGKYPIKR